ncbi:unnamed protein product, partial [Didymodactylos carnosus]
RFSSPIYYIKTDNITFTIASQSYPKYNSSLPAPCTAVSGLDENGLNQTRIASVTFGKAMDVSQTVSAISSINRDQTQYFSFIEIVDYDRESAQPPALRAKFESFDTPNLGLFLALSSDGNKLAAFYDFQSIVVFNDVLTRTGNQYFNTSQGDLKLTYPTGFYADSISYKQRWIVVSGLMIAQNGAGICIPAVTVWQWNLTSNTWDMLTSSASTGTIPFPAIRSSTWDPTNAVNFLFTPQCTFLPSNLLPIKISNDGQYMVLGVPVWQSVFCGTTADFFTTQLILFGSPDTVDKLNFGKSVDFAAQDSSLIQIQSQGLIFILNSLVWNSSDPFHLASSIVPNRLQRKSFHDTVTQRFFTQSASSSNLTVALYNSNPLDPSTELFPIPTALPGEQFDFGLNEYIPCPRGRYKLLGQSPCALCPLGTYQDEIGQTNCKPCDPANYCSLGSTAQISPLNEVWELPESFEDFDAEAFREGFEDLLINAIFSPTTPPMIILFIIAGTTAIILILYLIPGTGYLHPYFKKALSLYEWVLLPTAKTAETAPSHNDAESVGKSLGNHTKTEMTTAISQYNDLHSHSHYPKTFDDHKTRPKIAFIETNCSDLKKVHNNSSFSTVQELLSLSSNNALKTHIDSNTSDPKSNYNTSSSIEARINTEFDAMKAHDIHRMHEQERMLHGFFNAVFIMFVLSSLIYSGLFIASYNPSKNAVYGTSTNRYAYEQLTSNDVSDLILQSGLEAISLVAANISLTLYGYSGECVQFDMKAYAIQA